MNIALVTWCPAPDLTGFTVNVSQKERTRKALASRKSNKEKK